MRWIALVLLAFAWPAACAPKDACLRHSDCDDGARCIEGQCRSPADGGGGSGGEGGEGGAG